MRLVVHVRPGAHRTAVGGAHDGALVVRVRERAVEGRATAAVQGALAAALGVRVPDVTLISGATSRTKTFQVPDSAAPAVQRLLSMG